MRRRAELRTVRLEDLPDWVVQVPRPTGSADPRRALHDLPLPVNWWADLQAQCTGRRQWLTEHAPHILRGELEAERRRRWPPVDRVSHR